MNQDASPDGLEPSSSDSESDGHEPNLDAVADEGLDSLAPLQADVAPNVLPNEGTHPLSPPPGSGSHPLPPPAPSQSPPPSAALCRARAPLRSPYCPPKNKGAASAASLRASGSPSPRAEPPDRPVHSQLASREYTAGRVVQRARAELACANRPAMALERQPTSGLGKPTSGLDTLTSGSGSQLRSNAFCADNCRSCTDKSRSCTQRGADALGATPMARGRRPLSAPLSPLPPLLASSRSRRPISAPLLSPLPSTPRNRESSAAAARASAARVIVPRTFMMQTAPAKGGKALLCG